MAAHQSITTKRCRKCGAAKPLSGFHRHPDYCDGRKTTCAECSNRAARDQDYRAQSAELARRHPGMIGPATSVLDAEGRDWSWAFVIFSLIDGFPGYAVGTDGSLWTRAARGKTDYLREIWKPLQPCDYYPPRHRDPYHRVTLRRGGRSTYFFVQRLVLAAFVGPCPEGMEACHRNDISTDNRLGNLRWDTHRGNMGDRARNRGYATGEDHPMAKVTDDAARRIMERYDAGESARSLGQEFGIHRTSVIRVIRRARLLIKEVAC